VESKLLNLPDAMKLAQIVSKYVDTESLVGMSDAEVTIALFSEIEEEELIFLLQLLEIGDSQLDSESMTSIIINSLKDNNLVGILGTYQNIGFQN